MIEEPDRPDDGPWLKLFADVVDRKAHYTDLQFRGLIRVFALAARTRGWLPSPAALTRLIGPATLRFLYDEGDLEESEGRAYVHGWSRYQAKAIDVTATERKRRQRAKEAEAKTASPEAPVKFTEAHREVQEGPGEASPRAMSRVTDRDPSTLVVTSRLSSSLGTTRESVVPSAPEDPWSVPEAPVLRWLAAHRAAIDPNGNGLHRKICRYVEVHGVEATIAAFEALAAGGATEPRQFILGADDVLSPIPQAPRRPAETDEQRELRETRERIEARQRAKETT